MSFEQTLKNAWLNVRMSAAEKELWQRVKADEETLMLYLVGVHNPALPWQYNSNRGVDEPMNERQILAATILARRLDSDETQAFLKKYGLRLKDNHGRSPLFHPLFQKEWRMAESLLEVGLDINELSENDTSVLSMMTLNQEGDLDLTQMTAWLLAHGAKIQVPGVKSSMAWAAHKGAIGIMKQFVAADPASVNHKDAHGLTPLHSAALAQKKDAVLLLLQCGADPLAEADNTHARKFRRASQFTASEEIKEILIRAEDDARAARASAAPGAGL